VGESRPSTAGHAVGDAVAVPVGSEVSVLSDLLLTVRQLVSALGVEDVSVGGIPGVDRLAETVQLIDELTEPVGVVPATAPVVDEWLERAVTAAPDRTRVLAEAVLRASPRLHWVRRAYADEPSSPQMDAWRSGYSYAVLAGPESPGGSADARSVYLSDDLLLGFSLQAPGLMYPPHNHEAVELYGVISGTARWYHPESGWVERPPGAVTVNEAYQIHAMETVNEPMLTWVAWVTCPTVTPAMIRS